MLYLSILLTQTRDSSSSLSPTSSSSLIQQCCAIDYIVHTLDSATALLNSPKAFPSRYVFFGTILAPYGKSELIFVEYPFLKHRADTSFPWRGGSPGYSHMPTMLIVKRSSNVRCVVYPSICCVVSTFNIFLSGGVFPLLAFLSSVTTI